MAGRIRTIKPELPQSETIGSLSREARLLFILLFTVVDDEGRARAAIPVLTGALYPYDEDAPQLIGGWLDELESAGCIRRYDVGGKRYLDLPKWREHQRINRPSESRLPGFSETSVNNHGASSEGSMPDRDQEVDQDRGSWTKDTPSPTRRPPKRGSRAKGGTHDDGGPF